MRHGLVNLASPSFAILKAVLLSRQLFCFLERKVSMKKRNPPSLAQNAVGQSYPALLILLLAVLLAAVLGSLCLGRYPIRLREIAGILFSRIFPMEPHWTPTQEALFLNHRLPRVIMACLVGGCLSAAGAAYQGVFQNPMAAPDLLGASAGAGFGAALAILLKLGAGMTVAFAFGFSLLTVFVVTYIGSRARGRKVVGLILSGIMVGSLISSGTSFVKLIADPNDQLPAITYWLMGSLNGVSLQEFRFALLPMLLGLGILLLLRWRINVLSLGDEEARTMGVHAGRLRLAVILGATLVTAASVAVSGVIGWVGLVIPHLARRLVGNNYRYLLPAAILLGGSFLLLVDDVSRNLFATELPIGILTAFLGAPFFLYLISKEGELL